MTFRCSTRSGPHWLFAVLAKHVHRPIRSCAIARSETNTTPDALSLVKLPHLRRRCLWLNADTRQFINPYTVYDSQTSPESFTLSDLGYALSVNERGRTSYSPTSQAEISYCGLVNRTRSAIEI